MGEDKKPEKEKYSPETKENLKKSFLSKLVRTYYLEKDRASKEREDFSKTTFSERFLGLLGGSSLLIIDEKGRFAWECEEISCGYDSEYNLPRVINLDGFVIGEWCPETENSKKVDLQLIPSEKLSVAVYPPEENIELEEGEVSESQAFYTLLHELDERGGEVVF